MIITINTNNAAFRAPEDKGAEMARILRRLADAFEADGDHNGTIQASNGKTVGAVKGK